MSISQATVKHLYNSVIDDVLANCREAFLDDGVDDSVLQELRTLWEQKLLASKAVVVNTDPVDPQPPPLPKNSKPGGAKKSQTAQQVAVQPATESAGDTSVPPLAGTVTNNGSTVQATNSTNPQTVNNIHQTLVATNHINQINRPMTQVVQPVTQTVQSLVSNQQLQPGLLQQQQPQPQPQPQPVPSQLPMVPITITLPSVDSAPRSITIQVPPAAVSGDSSIYSTILSQVLTGPLIAAALQLPQNVATNLVQQQVTAAFQGLLSQFNTPKPDFQQAVEQNNPISQLDGALDTSDEDDDDDDDDDDDLDDDENDDKDEDENDENEGGAEEEPLNSGDDVSDDDPTELFETDNVVVCQYDKITRSRNKWKFYLKDGIMNLNGKDYIFQRANGDAEW